MQDHRGIFLPVEYEDVEVPSQEVTERTQGICQPYTRREGQGSSSSAASVRVSATPSSGTNGASNISASPPVPRSCHLHDLVGAWSDTEGSSYVLVQDSRVSLTVDTTRRSGAFKRTPGLVRAKGPSMTPQGVFREAEVSWGSNFVLDPRESQQGTEATLTWRHRSDPRRTFVWTRGGSSSP